MRQQALTISRGGVAGLLALLAVTLTGCGVGRVTNEEKISKTATTYLRALADGDTAKACAQLTRRARGGRCETATRELLSRLESDTLKNAADGSLDIDVHGDSATAGLSEPDGARFLLARVGGEWRIDSGYTLGSATPARIPATPVGTQLTWALVQLNRGAARLSQEAVTAHFSREFLSVVMPASGLVAMFGQTARTRAIHLRGFRLPAHRHSGGGPRRDEGRSAGLSARQGRPGHAGRRLSRQAALTPTR